MKNSRIIKGILLAALVVLTAAGSVSAQFDPSSLAFMGDSLTFGFMSSAMHEDAQRNSYPSLIYQQVNGGSRSGFEQPTVTSPGLPIGILELRSLVPLVITPAPGRGAPSNLTLPRPYDNLGVPGATVHDLLTTVTDGGGPHDVVLRGVGTQLEQTIAKRPSFVSMWIGNSDALAAATSGRVIEGVTLTPLEDFRQDYLTIIGALAQFGINQGVLANVPSVTSIPFVTTLPPVVVNPATQQPVIINGQLVPIIGVKDGVAQPLALNDYVLLTASGPLSQGFGIPPALGGNGQPLADQFILDANETATIENRINGYNGVIRAAANQAGFALVDIHSLFGDVARHGFELAGIEYTVDFLTGGLFSYDGVHATPFGYAYVANAFIEAINANYDAGIQPVDLGRFVFGGEGAMPTGRTPSANGEFIFTKRAWKALRWGLGVPRDKKLKRLGKAR